MRGQYKSLNKKVEKRKNKFVLFLLIVVLLIVVGGVFCFTLINKKTIFVCDFTTLTGDCGPYSKDENHVYYKNRASFPNKDGVYATYNSVISTDPAFTLILNKWSKNSDGSYNWSKIYAKDKDSVYLLGAKIKGADPGTFVQVGDGNEYQGCRSDPVGKDKDHVYSAWYEVINHLGYPPDIDTFESIGCGYQKDKNYIYYSGSSFSTNVETFQIIDQYFAKDKDNVYVMGNFIKNVDVDSFISLGGGKAKDKNKSYDSSEITKQIP